MEDKDETVCDDVEAEIKEINEAIEQLELELLLSGKYDANNAILTLHAGAGGTEAQDWTQMLLRMYGRWAERNGFSVETADLLPGDEAGVKSVTLLIKGHNAYGYLKSEKGVHRLVRISPFDACILSDQIKQKNKCVIFHNYNYLIFLPVSIYIRSVCGIPCSIIPKPPL